MYPRRAGLAALLKDPELREGLAARAKEHMRREFTPKPLGANRMSSTPPSNCR